MFESARLREWRQAGHIYLHRGHEVYYRTAGDGPALVCIHGFPTASWDWHQLWPSLAQRFRVVALDLIGYGFSAKPKDYDYSTFDQADLVEGLLTQLGIQRALVLAHDYGDTVTQELLARRLDAQSSDRFEIKSVCLLNGGLFQEAARPRPIQKLLLTPLGPVLGVLYSKRSFRRTFSGLFGPTTRPTDRELDEFWALITHNGGKAIVHKLIRYLRERSEYRERWLAALTRAPAPIRFVNGPEDPVSGRQMANRYRELVPDADVVLLDGIGHYPQIEDPGGVLRAFLEFVDCPRA